MYMLTQHAVILNQTHFKLILLFFAPLLSFGQIMEETLPLQYLKRPSAPLYKTFDDTIQLPIIDDFSWKKSYPRPDFWADRDVFVNTTFCVGPLSIGVATFDGTDEFGFPYAINQNGSDTVADYLTSRYIRFQNPPVNLMLSFLYQRGGLGEVPETEDSLVVEFWSPQDTTWQQVWSTVGTGTLSNFRVAAIPVDDAKYLVDGFRFRLGAYGARNGVFDVWNVDYIQLDANRNPGDTIISEPAFVRQHPFLTEDFTHIPWFHYSDALLQNNLTFTYRRNGPPPPGGWALNLGKYVFNKDGNQLKAQLTVPVITNLTHNVDIDFNVPLQPISSGIPTGEFTFFMRTWFDGTAEGLRANDTLERSIPFKNYYAFDDGTAERAYGILNQNNARVAIEFQPLAPDTLRGLMINFAHAGTDAEQNSFRIAVWSFDNGQPGSPIYVSDSVYKPQYGYYHNDFMPFELDTPVYIPGAVYIGYIQSSANAIHIGLDQNTLNATPKFYGNGFIWYQSLVPGTVMLRPYFKYTPVNLGEDEAQRLNVNVYPNPATDALRIENASHDNVTWEIYNLTGQRVASGDTDFAQVAHLPRGIYIVHVKSNRALSMHKIVLQ